MINKAANEGIVVRRTTFYDRFFSQAGGLNTNMTTARLPYFDGDYWPSAIEKYLKDIKNEGSGLSNPFDAAEIDALLMQRVSSFTLMVQFCCCFKS